MKKQINQKLPAFTAIILFSILIFNGSCSKDAKSSYQGNSRIVYTNVAPDSVILKSTIDSFQLDMNHDGIDDFVFSASVNGSTCGADPLFGGYQYYINISVAPANENNEIINDGTYALAMDSSSAIVSDSSWANAPQTLITALIRSGGRCITQPFHEGYWLNQSDKYLGLRFTKGNNIYYGWARLSSSYHIIVNPFHLSNGQLILKDYAYNSIPNQPILAGQTK